MRKGFFITLEGGEGVGKSTQIQKLAAALTAQGHDIVVTREPGGTQVGEDIRQKLENPNLSPQEEVKLFLEARAAHLEQVIGPALKAGKTVLCDRFIDSSRVYQGILQGRNQETMQMFEDQAHEFMPDLTLILDLPAQETLKRVEGRGGARDHYDQGDAAHHEKIRQGFLDLAAKEPDRCVVIDASQPLEDVATQIIETVLKRLTTSGDTHF